MGPDIDGENEGGSVAILLSWSLPPHPHPTPILRATENSGFLMVRNRRPAVYTIFSPCTSGSYQECLGEYSKQGLSEYPGSAFAKGKGMVVVVVRVGVGLQETSLCTGAT